MKIDDWCTLRADGMMDGMGFYAIWPYFVGSALIFALAGTGLMRPVDDPSAEVRARVQTIDGLRGFLALGVFFHHAAIYHQYLLTGRWALPPSRFYANLGQAGVALFFMITGYLFWTQMLRARGRPNFVRLYVGRVFRIVPLYLVLAVTVMLCAWMLGGWHRNVPVRQLIHEALNWLAGGMLLGGDVNAVPTVGVSAGVTWSLQYEWWFYGSLLVASVFARRVVLGVALPVVGLLVFGELSLRHPLDMSWACWLMFCVGMTVAAGRVVLGGVRGRVPQWVLSAGVVLCLGLALLGFDGVYHPGPVLVLGVAFGLVVSGATVFGVLGTRAARRLGDVSYGIYLLQGPVLFLAFSGAWVRAAALGSAWAHWGVVLVAGGVLVGVATVAHCWVERPGILVGRGLLRWLGAGTAGS